MVAHTDITHRTSHITHYTSHIAHHARIHSKPMQLCMHACTDTHHTSQITHHTSHITHQTSHLTHHKGSKAHSARATCTAVPLAAPCRPSAASTALQHRQLCLWGRPVLPFRVHSAQKLLEVASSSVCRAVPRQLTEREINNYSLRFRLERRMTRFPSPLCN